MSEDKKLARGDAAFDQSLEQMMRAYEKDPDGYVSTIQAVQRVAQRAERWTPTRADTERLIRLAHLGSGVLVAKLLNRTVL